MIREEFDKGREVETVEGEGKAVEDVPVVSEDVIDGVDDGDGDGDGEGGDGDGIVFPVFASCTHFSNVSLNSVAILTALNLTTSFSGLQTSSA